MFRRSSRTSLRLSLDRTTTHPNSVCPAWLDKHRSDIFRVRAMDNESALYWMDEDDEKLSLAFAAVLNHTYIHNERYDILRDIQRSRISSYRTFTTTFSLSPLPNTPNHDVPKEAIESSALALEILRYIYEVTERVLQDHPPLASHVPSLPFHHTDRDSHETTFMVRTPKLMETASCPLPEDCSSFFTNHGYMQLPFHQNSNLVERRFDVVPNVRDCEGHSIMPTEYDSKMKNGSIVIVNVHLKLEVLEDESRRYQTIINSMQTLPITNTFHIFC